MEPEKYQVNVDPSANRRFAYHIEFLSRVSESAAVRLYDGRYIVTENWMKRQLVSNPYKFKSKEAVQLNVT